MTVAPGTPALSSRQSAARPGRRRFVIIGVLAVLAVALVGGAMIACATIGGGDQPTYVARDSTLRNAGLYLYPAVPQSRAPRAFVFFFGNDIGFWRAHRQLAADLATQGYAVAGFDMVPFLHALPDGRAARDSAFRARISPLILSARRELVPPGSDVPIVLAGHSLGAEVALWTAAWAGLPHVVGVLALSPGSRSHLRVAASDVLMTSEPTGPESFAVADVVARVTGPPANERVAIVRGENDELKFADPALLAAGGARAKRFVVPLANHGLKQITFARYVVRRAIAWVMDGADAGAGAVSPSPAPLRPADQAPRG